jgi:hypothetical protein
MSPKWPRKFIPGGYQSDIRGKEARKRIVEIRSEECFHKKLGEELLETDRPKAACNATRSRRKDASQGMTKTEGNVRYRPWATKKEDRS